MFAFFDWVIKLVNAFMRPIIEFMKVWVAGCIGGAIIGALIEVGVMGMTTMMITIVFAFIGGISNTVTWLRKK